MPSDSSIPLTWPQFLAHLQHLWGRPIADFMPELLPYFRHELIGNFEPVLVGAKVLTNFYEMQPVPKAWLKQCIEAADAWVWECRRVSDNCIAENEGNHDAQCQCFLKNITPLFKDCAGLLATYPEDELATLEPDVAQILTTIKSSLVRLVTMAEGLKRGDLTWLKEIFDEIERKKHGVG
jgi:hypothetical protein